MSHSPSPKELKAMFAKQRAGGTLPFQMNKNDPRKQFDIEKIKGTDELIVRQKGEVSGTVTTAKDLDRVLVHIAAEKKMQSIIDKKMENISKNRKLTEAQRRKVAELQRRIVVG